MRIFKMAAVLVTILWVSAIGWEQATRRVETDDLIVADVDDSDPIGWHCNHPHMDLDAFDPCDDPDSSQCLAFKAYQPIEYF